jgi:hypothetical protein
MKTVCCPISWLSSVLHRCSSERSADGRPFPPRCHAGRLPGGKQERAVCLAVCFGGVVGRVLVSAFHKGLHPAEEVVGESLARVGIHLTFVEIIVQYSIIQLYSNSQASLEGQRAIRFLGNVKFLNIFSVRSAVSTNKKIQSIIIRNTPNYSTTKRVTTLMSFLFGNSKKIIAATERLWIRCPCDILCRPPHPRALDKVWRERTYVDGHLTHR